MFLGSGASGGTPGRVAAADASSLLVEGEVRMLIDVTRDATAQLQGIGRLDARSSTRAHRDASGGIPALRRRDGDASPLPVFAHAKTLARSNAGTHVSTTAT